MVGSALVVEIALLFLAGAAYVLRVLQVASRRVAEDEQQEEIQGRSEL